MAEILHDHELDYLVSRLKNQTGSGEGLNLPPRLKGGYRIPFVTGVRVLSQNNTDAGTKIVIGWDAAPSSSDLVVREYAVYALGVFGTTQLHGPFSVTNSPVEIMLQLDAPRVVTFKVKTVLTNGLSSSLDNSPTCSASVPAFPVPTSTLGASPFKFDAVTVTDILTLAIQNLVPFVYDSVVEFDHFGYSSPDIRDSVQVSESVSLSLPSLSVSPFDSVSVSTAPGLTRPV